MKNMQLYSNKNMQQVCRYGLAAMVFFVGTASAFAQDDTARFACYAGIC